MQDNDFTEVIKNYRGGELLHEINELYRQVVESVSDTVRPGEIILKLTIKPATKSGAMPVFAKLSSKLPELPREPQSYFMGEDGGLQINHPLQVGMFDKSDNITPIKTREDNK